MKYRHFGRYKIAMFVTKDVVVRQVTHELHNSEFPVKPQYLTKDFTTRMIY